MAGSPKIAPGRAFKAKKGRSTKKPPSRSKLTKLLDAVFSKYIRTKYGNKCYTCGQTGKMQAGHYISRSMRSTRWEEDNCRPQCFGCNLMHGGRPIDFREHLIKDFGEEWVKFLERKRHDIFQQPDSWLLLKIIEFENRLAELPVDN